MKITFVVSSMGSGGAERVVSHLSNQFVKEGHKVTILMISIFDKTSFYYLDKNIELIPLLSSYGKQKYFKKVRIMKEHFLKTKPDIVLAFLPHVCIYTYFALRKTEIPFILSERNDPNQYNMLYKIILKQAFRNADGCVFQTNDCLKWYKNNRKIKNTDKIIYNPVNINVSKELLDFNKRKKNVLFIGRINRQKNYKLLLKTFASFRKRNKEYILDYYGEGSEKPKFMSLVKKYNLDDYVVMHGNDPFWQNEQINSGLFLSTSKFEGMPNSLLEAATLQIPCVATDCPIGGSKELSKVFSNIFLVPNKSKPAEIVEVMEKAIKSSSSFVEEKDEFSLCNISNQWLQLIYEVTSKNRLNKK